MRKLGRYLVVALVLLLSPVAAQPHSGKEADGERGDVVRWVDSATGELVATLPETRAGDRAVWHGRLGSDGVASAPGRAVAGPPGDFLIDFDTFPDSSAVPEGTNFSNQYAAYGVLFGGASTAEDASGNASSFPGMSLPNYLTFGGYSPGPGASLGCIINVDASFAPAATAVSFDAFAGVIGTSGVFGVTALDAGGGTVDTDSFVVTSPSFPTPDVFSLTVSAPEIASIQLNGTDVCAAIDNFQFTTRSPTAIDLVVSKTESTEVVVAGSGPGNLTHTVTVANNGPGDASGVVLSEVLTLPAGVTVDSITPSAGTFAGTTWTLGNLANGAAETLTVTLTVAASAELGTNLISDTASVTSVNETDTDPANDSATESTSISPDMPTLGPGGLAALAILLVAVFLMARRKSLV